MFLLIGVRNRECGRPALSCRQVVLAAAFAGIAVPSVAQTVTSGAQERAPLTLSLAAVPAVAGRAGETIAVTVTVANNGGEPVTGIAVTGVSFVPECPGGGSTIAELAPGGSASCTGRHHLTQAELDHNGGGDGTIEFEASAASAAGTAAARGAVRLDIRPSLKIEKSYAFASDFGTPAAADADDVISYLYAVTNSGNVTISDVSVTDAHGGAGLLLPAGRETLVDDAPPYGDSRDGVAGDGRWQALAPGDTVVFGADYTVIQADMDRR